MKREEVIKLLGKEGFLYHVSMSDRNDIPIRMGLINMEEYTALHGEYDEDGIYEESIVGDHSFVPYTNRLDIMSLYKDQGEAFNAFQKYQLSIDLSILCGKKQALEKEYDKDAPDYKEQIEKLEKGIKLLEKAKYDLMCEYPDKYDKKTLEELGKTLTLGEKK